MTNHWKTRLQQAREWLLESRKTPQGRRILATALLAFLAWAAGFLFLYQGRDLPNRVSLQASRFTSLVEVSRVYLSLPAAQRQGTKTPQSADPLSEASRIVERLGLKNRLKSISGSGQGVALQLEGLGQEELVELAKELDRAKLETLSAEVRVLPLGGQRKLSLNLLLGGRQ